MHLKHRENEREQHKHDEAVVHFNALLADLVCHPYSLLLICMYLYSVYYILFILG